MNIPTTGMNVRNVSIGKFIYVPVYFQNLLYKTIYILLNKNNKITIENITNII